MFGYRLAGRNWVEALICVNPQCTGTASSGGLYSGTFTRLHVSDLTGNASIGPRIPDAAAAPKQFRLATIVVTRDGLLSPEAMSFYSLFAQRMELRVPTPVHLGLLKATSYPFAVSRRGLGAMSARITPDPSLPQIVAVVDAASFQPRLAPGAWIAITGGNLAATVRTSTNQDIVDGMLPQTLDGVSVSIGGYPAAISYISPAQLNAQVPTETALGASVPLVVNAPQGKVSTTVAVQAIAPGLFAFGGKYVAAQHADYSLVGSSDLYPGATPARPAETILIYGAGFGPTTPAVPGGQVVSQAAPMITTPTFQIGGRAAAVSFAGIVAAGLYQFNVLVPSGLSDGDALVVANDSSVTTQSSVYLTIQN